MTAGESQEWTTEWCSMNVQVNRGQIACDSKSVHFDSVTKPLSDEQVVRNAEGPKHQQEVTTFQAVCQGIKHPRLPH